MTSSIAINVLFSSSFFLGKFCMKKICSILLEQEMVRKIMGVCAKTRKLLANK